MKSIIALSVLLLSLWLLMLMNGPSQTLDNKFFYDGLEASNFFQGLSDEVQRIYFRKELIDLVYMLVYGILFAMSLRKLNFRWPQVGLIPLLFDSVETNSILILLTTKAFTIDLAWLGWVTLFKWLSAIAVVVLIILLLIQKKIQGSSSRS